LAINEIMLKKKILHQIRRNPFVALCDHASRNNWCWRIHCTTCRHGEFRIAFSKIIHSQHPDDKSFWSHKEKRQIPLREINKYNTFLKDASTTDQMKLASALMGAKLSDIQAVAKFPDWLGYLGLVIYHCPNRIAQKIISDILLSQFIMLIKNDLVVHDYLLEKQNQQKLLSTEDLSVIEKGLLNYNNNRTYGRQEK